MKHWRGPQYEGEFPTLGYEVLDWLHAHLPSPADDTKPFTPTPEQSRLVYQWYRLDPRSGRFIHRRGAIEMAKGWGKSPLVAALALAEFAGPALFDGWNAEGEPVARPWGTGEDPAPWVQVAANSEDQSENTYGAIYAYLTARDGRVASGLGIDQGRTRLYLKDVPGSKLEPVTASAGSREGQRVTFAVLDETHLWTKRSRGMQLASTLRRNLAKMSGRSLETTNAPSLGEGSVAEETGDAAERGEPGIWHYTRRPTADPQPDWDDERMKAELEIVYGDARWVDRDRILREIRDSSTDWPDALRYYFNVRSAAASRLVDPRRWAELAKPQEVPPGTYIGLGFDGSFSQDATALVACTREGYSWPIEIWERPRDAPASWRIDRLAVQRAVRETFATYKVGLMLCDPWKWQTELAEWAETYGEDVVLEFNTNQTVRHAAALDRWRTAVAEGTHTHAGDPRLTAHVLAAHLRKARAQQEEDGRTLYVMTKGEDRRKIDAAVADVLALEAAMTMPDPVDDTRYVTADDLEFNYAPL